MDRHGQRKHTRDPGKSEHLVSPEKLDTLGEGDHGHDMHDADGQSADQHMGKLRGSKRKNVATVLESRKAGPNPDGEQLDILIRGLEYVYAEQYRQKLHHLLHQRGEENGSVFGRKPGCFLEKARNIRRQYADNHARKETGNTPTRTPLGKQQRNRKRHRNANQDILSINHQRQVPFSTQQTSSATRPYLQKRAHCNRGQASQTSRGSSIKRKSWLQRNPYSGNS